MFEKMCLFVKDIPSIFYSESFRDSNGGKIRIGIFVSSKQKQHITSSDGWRFFNWNLNKEVLGLMSVNSFSFDLLLETSTARFQIGVCAVILETLAYKTKTAGQVKDFLGLQNRS